MTPVSIFQAWEGHTVSGVFPLLEWLGGSADRGVFLTVRHGMKTASIKLILAEGVNADAYLAKWEAAKALSHPCLVPVMDTGRCTIDGKDLVYVVTDRAEEVLSETIPGSALDPDRARGIFDRVLDALSYVHEKEFVHGRVKPSNILLVDDEWKLSADSLRAAGEGQKAGHEADVYDAPEVIEGRLTAAADMWSLGMTVAEALLQRAPTWDRSTQGDPTVPESLPEPFLEIVRGCLRSDPEERCKIAEIKALLSRDALVPAVAGQVPETTASAEVEAEPERVAVEPIPVTAEPERVVEEPIPVMPEQASVVPEPEPVAVAADSVAHGEVQSGKVEPVDAQVNERVSERVREPEDEHAEPAPTLRLFANLEEEKHEGRVRVGRFLFGVVVLLAIGAVFLVRSHKIKLPLWVETRIAPAPVIQPPPQTQTPGETGSPATASEGATPPRSPDALPGESGSGPEKGQSGQAAQPTPESQPAVGSAGVSKSEPAISQPTAQTQAPLTAQTQTPPTASKGESQSASDTNPATGEAHPQPSGPPEVLHKENSEGAVVKRVLPAVSRGASSSMRGPVQVEVRVSVNEEGRVTNAEYVSHGPGNYFARVAHEAARSWKFRPPERGGHAKSSIWTLRFHFEREKTEVSATEVRWDGGCSMQMQVPRLPPLRSSRSG